MSLLSRLSAPVAGDEPAHLVAAFPSGLPAAAPAPAAPARRLPAGPTGLGTSGLRIGRKPPDKTTSVPELYCPGPVRDDPLLGEEVNDRLIAWAEEVGVYPGRLDQVRAANYGRMIMLTHPDTDDPDRLLAAAKCVLAEFAADDHYCDDESAGARPELLGPRLAIAMAAVDPAHLPVRYAPELEQAMRDDPVLVALRSALEHLARYATWSQVTRLRYEIDALFVAFGQEAGWRTAGRLPPVWEYLAHRRFNSFLPCITLIDPIVGYALPTAEYSHPRVRRVITMAATASTLVNDLYSMTKEQHAGGLDFNLPTVIAAEEHCSLREAIERSARIHDELVHTFEAEAALLRLDGSPALSRFLSGVWAWLGGNREWHGSTTRYNG
ncbi:MAG: family 2 encapsulin nanocompartment cargo protein terpene cyclase [Actinomadura sp.]